MFKKRVFFLLLVSLLGSIAGLYLWKFNDCGYSSFCLFLFSKVGLPMFYGMGALAVVFFGLLFAPKAVSAWWKFAIFYIPYYVYAVLTAGPSVGQMIYIGMSVQETAIWLSGVYVVVSLMLIALSLRKKN